MQTYTGPTHTGGLTLPYRWPRISIVPRTGRCLIIAVFIILIVSCGAPPVPEVVDSQQQATITPLPMANTEKTPAPESTASQLGLPTPISLPTGTPPDSSVNQVQGAINVGISELGSLEGAGDPKALASPVLGRLNMTVYETLVVSAPNGDLVPRLAEDWQVSPDGLTWTFSIRDGVPFHDAGGELSADDVAWTWIQSTEPDSRYGGAGPVASLIRGLNQLKVVNQSTVQVVNDKPRFDMLFSFRAPYRHGLAIQSRAAFDRQGPDPDGTQLTGTGPWRLIEVSPSDYWKLEAVESHWREIPKFQELILWQIAAESSRIASLKTGALDTAEVDPQSVDQLRQIPNMKFTRAPDAGQFAWNLHGQFYSTKRPGYDPSLPWVSSDPDTGSAEWNRARKVRLAMALAIDREALVRDVLKGQGRAQHYWIDAGNSWLDPLKEAEPTPFRYDPTRAIKLLEEAGYPEGFDAEVACYPRGIPYEMEVCREIATKMWPAVGIKTKVNELTYAELRPDVLRRGLGLLAPHPLGTYTEPMALYPNGVWRIGSWNTGFEHPEIDALVAEALAQADSTQRAIPTLAIAEWIRDKVTHIPVYTPDLLYPAGPRIQPWQLQGGDKKLIHNFEFIQPR